MIACVCVRKKDIEIGKQKREDFTSTSGGLVQRSKNRCKAFDKTASKLQTHVVGTNPFLPPNIPSNTENLFQYDHTEH